MSDDLSPVEEWRDVAGWEGLYQVSNLGRVRSLPRVLRNRWGEYTTRGQVLKGRVSPSGVMIHHFTGRDGQTAMVCAHRLAAIAFVPNPESAYEVGFADGNRANLAVENLVWMGNPRGAIGQGAEQWKPVAGYEGYYEVSTLGRVRNAQRGNVLRCTGNKAKDRYWTVTLCKDNVRTTRVVHILVAEAFIPNPDGLPQVNHKDLDKTNNRVENLEWITPAQNVEHAWATRYRETGTKWDGPRGHDVIHSKLVAAQVLEMRRLHSEMGLGTRRLSRRYGISRPAVSAILKRQHWKHI